MKLIIGNTYRLKQWPEVRDSKIGGFSKDDSAYAAFFGKEMVVTGISHDGWVSVGGRTGRRFHESFFIIEYKNMKQKRALGLAT